MRKIKKAGIISALSLIASGAMGFGYLIKIGGAGPEISWSCGMGPFIAGILILAILSLKRQKNPPALLLKRR